MGQGTSPIGKLIGYARVSARQKATDRQQEDLLGVGVRRCDLYIDQGVSGARASRPGFEHALNDVHDADTLVVTTLDRLGRSTQNTMTFAEDLRHRGPGLRVLNLGRGHVDTFTPGGSMVFTVMAALAQMELEIKGERTNDSVIKQLYRCVIGAGSESPSAGINIGNMDLTTKDSCESLGRHTPDRCLSGRRLSPVGPSPPVHGNGRLTADTIITWSRKLRPSCGLSGPRSCQASWRAVRA